MSYSSVMAERIGSDERRCGQRQVRAAGIRRTADRRFHALAAGHWPGALQFAARPKRARPTGIAYAVDAAARPACVARRLRLVRRCETI
jgi:hypothetical protein